MTEEIDPENFVFYSDSTVGQPKAKAFCDANEEEGYKYFYYIFDDAFSQAFGGADPSADTEIAKACSQAMGEYAQGDTRVFNHAGGELSLLYISPSYASLLPNGDNLHARTKPTTENSANTASDSSFWLTIELPALQSNSDVTAIFTMKDATTDPDDHDSDLKNNAATCSCTENGCSATSSPCCANGSCTGKRDAVRTLETVFKRALSARAI